MSLMVTLGIFVVIINIFFSMSLIFIERKDPTTTWAWLLIFIVLPGLGFAIYLLFGQNLSRQKMFKKKTLRDERKKNVLNNMHTSYESSHDGGEKFSDLMRMNFNNLGAQYKVNNSVNVFVNGEDKFKQLVKDIRNAKKYVHLQYYIFKKDLLGKTIIDELTKKAKEGLEVRLLVDGMGSRKLTKRLLRKFLDAGGKFAVFFPGILPHLNTRINYRNHRKIVVIDGEYGYVGGFNVGKEYINKDKEVGFWRDTHIRIHGDAVEDLCARFFLDWCYAADEEIENYEKYIVERKEKIGDVGIQIVTSGPDHKEQYIRNAYIKLINNAKKNVYLETPYFIPDAPVLEALKISALSGIDVRIIIPGNPDHAFMKWAASSYIGELLEAGVRVYSYTKGFIHAKTVVADGTVMSIGTANMDIRSFKLNFEVNAFIYDDRVALEGQKQFKKDIHNSYEITRDIYDKRKRLLRLKESMVRLLSPIL